MMSETLIKTYADLQKYNFFRTPEWRWDRILKLVDRHPTPGRCTRRDDDFVRKARNFILRWRSAEGDDEKERLKFENPAIHYAYDFHQKSNDDPEAVMYVQARLLARQDPEHIGSVMGILPDAVLWYSWLFFDVIDRLEQRDWITKQIIVPAMVRQGFKKKKKNGPQETDESYQVMDSSVAKPFMDGSLKLFAYFGGTHLVDALIAGLQAGKPLSSPDEISNWMDSTWMNVLKRRSLQAAMAFEINKYNVTEVFAVHTRIIEIERSEESSEQARTSHERHVKAMIDGIPWAVGDDGRKLYDKSIVGRFDDMPGELRDDEVLQLASGQHVPGLATDFPKELPAPRTDKKSILMAQNTDL